jgi:ketosteroid isomerase-like protein
MNTETARMVQELYDRQAIRDQVNNYCRGVDRMDRELLLSVYHPDAIDDHGHFTGGVEAFIDWAFGYHGTYQDAHQHIVANHICELDGDVAHAETYWIFVGRNKQAPMLSMSGGRYIDRFEKRNGEWKIAVRKCVVDWGGGASDIFHAPEVLAAFAGVGITARDRSDVSYERPLSVDKSRVD